MPAQQHRDATGATGGVARIGPNAIIQTARALEREVGAPCTDTLLRTTTPYTLAQLPSAMVPEAEVRALVYGVHTLLGTTATQAILYAAGVQTGDYLLAHRIPRLAQWAMRLAPRPIGLRLLLAAMRANAWTFAGSGEFQIAHRRHGAILTFVGCAMCRGMHTEAAVCDFYAGTFARLIGVLIAPTVQVVETACMAQGAPACVFTVSLMPATIPSMSRPAVPNASRGAAFAGARSSH